MANHKSSQKRIRQNEKARVANRYFTITARNAVKKLRGTKDKTEAQGLFPQVTSMLDRLAKKNIIHKKKASNLKSQLQKHVSSL